jgi:arabinofuranan 3-O-arabinosyltransferase
VTVNGRETTDIVSARGTVTVPAQTATSLSLRFDNAEVVRSVDPQTGALEDLPIGVNEIRVLGAEDIPKGPLLADEVSVPCGLGPRLLVGGVVSAETSVGAATGELIADELVLAVPCEGRLVTLAAGRNRIEARSTDEYTVESLVLEPISAPSGRNSPGNMSVVTWDASLREIDVESSSMLRVLETTENFNEGWVATLNSQVLDPVRVDGWRQAWILPPGAGGVISLQFPAQRLYAGGLLAGLFAAIVLMAMAFTRRHGTRAATSGPAGTSEHTAESEAPSSRVWRGPGGHGRWLLAAGAVVTGGFMGGWVGAGVAVASMAAAWVLNRAAVSGGLALAAAGMAALLPWPERLEASAWMLGATALLALGALAATAAPCRAPSDDEPTQGSDARGQTTKH